MLPFVLAVAMSAAPAAASPLPAPSSQATVAPRMTAGPMLPVASPAPAPGPTSAPTPLPTVAATAAPTALPTIAATAVPTALPTIAATTAPAATPASSASPGASHGHHHHHHAAPAADDEDAPGTVELQAPEEKSKAPAVRRVGMHQSDSYRLKQACRIYLGANSAGAQVTRLLISQNYALCVYEDLYRTGTALFKRSGDAFIFRAVGSPAFDDAKTLQSFGVPQPQAHSLITRYLAI